MFFLGLWCAAGYFGVFWVFCPFGDFRVLGHAVSAVLVLGALLVSLILRCLWIGVGCLVTGLLVWFCVAFCIGRLGDCVRFRFWVFFVLVCWCGFV